MSEHLETEQISRLWEHFLHLDTNFYNRLNFFLVFESVLLGVVGLLYSRPNGSLLGLKLIMLLGFSLTILWGYIQARQKYLLDDLAEQVKTVAPEYRMTLERRKHAKWPVSSVWLLAYIVPILVALIWLLFLIFL
ncbi:hypothetical protein KSF_085510 [Reticulibacter mediterranei]|uniref:Uncharacterized protein n=1 Tax=Reticulibacter mediterranei TaxID=2778369 RepID=A0A8J3ITV9_9CHLR|nr:hypothetical protein KSF_085510 [Reticulibacter mediterranei]